MFARSKRSLRYTVSVLAVGLLFAPAAEAQTPNNTGTPPVNAQTPPSSAVDQFLANPAQSLAQYPNGGAALISLIRDIALARPDALKILADLLATANRDQQTAFGSGLGQAYKLVIATDQAYATQIAELIGNSKSENAQLAYAGATGDTSIGAAGGGGGGGGGSGGPTGSGGTSSGGTNTGSNQTNPTSFQTSSQTFTGGGGGASGASSSAPVSAR